jgi:cytochrome c oxidase assembly factor CtaG
MAGALGALGRTAAGIGVAVAGFGATALMVLLALSAGVPATPRTGDHATSVLPPIGVPSALIPLRPDAFGLIVCVAAGSAYAAGVIALRARGDRWPIGRTVAFTAGLALVAIVTCTAFGAYAMVLFSAHMAQHMVLSMIAPVLLVLGAPVTLGLRALDVTGRRRLLSVLRSGPARFVGHPATVTAVFVLGLYALYFTPLFRMLMSTPAGHLLMQAHFLVSGFLFFWLVLGVDPDPDRPPLIALVPLVLLVMLTHTAFSVVLVFGATPVFAAGAMGVAPAWAPEPVEDQAMAGAVAWALGEMASALVLAMLLMRWFGAMDRAERARGRARALRGGA